MEGIKVKVQGTSVKKLRVEAGMGRRRLQGEQQHQTVRYQVVDHMSLSAVTQHISQ